MSADSDAAYHRTFAMFSQPESEKVKFTAWERLFSTRNALYERAHAYERRAQAFSAFKLVAGRLDQVRLMPRPGQMFWSYATKWEWLHAPPPLIPKPSGRVQPVV